MDKNEFARKLVDCMRHDVRLYQFTVDFEEDESRIVIENADDDKRIVYLIRDYHAELDAEAVAEELCTKILNYVEEINAIFKDKRIIFDNTYFRVLNDKEFSIPNELAYKKRLGLSLYPICFFDERKQVYGGDLSNFCDQFGITLDMLFDHFERKLLEDLDVVFVNTMGNSKVKFLDLKSSDLHRDFDIIAFQSKNCVYASTALFSDIILKKISTTIYKDFYIIPSSIHDFIIYPTTKPLDMLKTLLLINNRKPELIKQNEVLSDNVYLYKDGKLSIAK